MTSGQPNTGQGLELQVISACVLGGVSLTGGVGTMIGVIVGVLIMGTVNNAMNLLNIQPFYQYLASGGFCWQPYYSIECVVGESALNHFKHVIYTFLLLSFCE